MDLWTAHSRTAGCPNRHWNPEKLHLPLHCMPGCQFQSMADSQRPLNAACTFCFRLTACSLHIQKTIIFMLFFLYLEVNGCQETNEAARNSCTSTKRLPCDAEGGIKQQTSLRLARKTLSLWHTHTHKLTVSSATHRPTLIFSFSPSHSGN